MTLTEPPQASAALSGLPDEPARGRTHYRVWRREDPDGTPRPLPWWFASVPVDPASGGRFDLAGPLGTCYTATRAVGAVLEALQATLVNLPRAELAARRLATISAPHDAPPAAKLTSRRGAGLGLTAAVWAGGDRLLTQRWAAALRRDGWWAVYAGLQHDPSGRLRGYALFDGAGAHPPSYGAEWPVSTSTLHDDASLHAELARYGVAVRAPGRLPYAAPPP